MEDISETPNTEMKKNQSGMQNTINEIQNTLDGVKSRLEEAEEGMNEIGDKVMESNQAEQMREKTMMQSKNRLRKLSDYIKHSNSVFLSVLPPPCSLLVAGVSSFLLLDCVCVCVCMCVCMCVCVCVLSVFISLCVCMSLFPFCLFVFLSRATSRNKPSTPHGGSKTSLQEIK